MKLSLSNWVFYRRPLDDCIGLVKKLGFKNIEFNMICVENKAKESVYKVKELINHYGLNCLSVHSAGLYVKNEKEVEKAVFYGKTSIDFASELSTPILVVHSYVSRKISKNLRKKFLKQIFLELEDYADKSDVKLALENLSLDSNGFGRSVSEVEEILRVINIKKLGITLDFCHAEEIGQTYNFLENFKDKIVNIHLSSQKHGNFNRKNSNLEAFLKKLLKINYKGPLTLEPNPRCKFGGIFKTKTVIEKVLEEFNQDYLNS